MAWVRLDDGFADNPKLERAGPKAGWLHVAALCYCSRQLTDGAIPWEKAARLVPSPSSALKALLAEGLWHKEGHDCPRCPPCPHHHYLIHDYLEYQPSRAQVLKERETARERMANARRNKGRSSGEHPPNVQANNGRSSDNPIPSPTPTDLKSSSELTSARDPTPDDDDRQPPGPHHLDHSPDLGKQPSVVSQALDILTDLDLDHRQRIDGLEPIGDTESWRRAARLRRINSDGRRLTELAQLDPDATPHQLVDALENRDEPSPWMTSDGAPFIVGAGAAPGLPPMPGRDENTIAAGLSATRAAMRQPLPNPSESP